MLNRDGMHWIFLRYLLVCLFSLVFPLLARLPSAWGRRGAAQVGKIYSCLDLDWRTVGLRKHFVSNQTREAFAEILHDPSPDALESSVQERFVASALEELEGHWLAIRRCAEFKCALENADAVLAYLRERKGIVLLTFHYDASIFGIAHLGRTGVTISPMSSNVVEDRRLPKCIQSYFQNKYAGLDSFLNGGRVMHAETQLKAFYERLRAGEGVVVLADAYTHDTNIGIVVRFFDKQRLIAPGAFRLAEKTGVAMAAFVCCREPDGSYRLIFSPVLVPESGSHRQNAQALFSFLESNLRQAPSRWWAADLLPNFAISAEHPPESH